MEIIDREREREWLEQMDTILIFVCFPWFWRWVGLMDFAGRIVRRLLECIPHRTPQSSRTRPDGYHTGRPDLSNPDDA